MAQSEERRQAIIEAVTKGLGLGQNPSVKKFVPDELDIVVKIVNDNFQKLKAENDGLVEKFWAKNGSGDE